MSKILIIGSKGFIGAQCVNYFSQQSNHVLGADVKAPGGTSNYFLLDASGNFDDIFLKQSFDVCVNASGSGDVGFSIKNPEKDFELNVKNVDRLLTAIRKYNPTCKLINFSSASVYGNPDILPVKESAVLNPLSPYGLHKLKSELLLKEYHNKYKLPTCSLRVFSAYGIGLKKQLFWDIYQKTLFGKTIILFGTGEESRDFIFIDDLIRAIDVVIHNGRFNGEAINVSSGIETRIRDAAEAFLSFLGKDFRLEFSGEEKLGDPKNWRSDISVLKQMGFTPFVTFEEGIRKYAEWLKGLKLE